MQYYWLNSIDLEPGAVVRPGTWYRIKQTTPLDIWYMIETIYEEVRTESVEFANLPSRKKALFLFLDKDLALRYQRENRLSDLLYEVEVVDAQAKSATLDMGIIQTNILVPSPHIPDAEKYWRSANQDSHQYSEFVTESSIKIIRKVSPT